MTQEVGISALASFIIGLPGETEETLRKTVEFANELHQEFGSLYGFHILSPFPGTEVRDKAKEYGLEILTDDWTQYDANHVVTRTPGADTAVIQSVADEYEETMERYMRYQDYLFAQRPARRLRAQDVPAPAPAIAALEAAARTTRSSRCRPSGAMPRASSSRPSRPRRGRLPTSPPRRCRGCSRWVRWSERRRRTACATPGRSDARAGARVSSARAMPQTERRSAIALGVQLPGVSDEEHASSLAELARLGKTLGVDVVARVTQRRGKLAPGQRRRRRQAARARAADRRERRRADGPARAPRQGRGGDDEPESRRRKRRTRRSGAETADAQAARRRRPARARASCSSTTTSRPRRRATSSAPPRPRCSTARP